MFSVECFLIYRRFDVDRVKEDSAVMVDVDLIRFHHRRDFATKMMILLVPFFSLDFTVTFRPCQRGFLPRGFLPMGFSPHEHR